MKKVYIVLSCIAAVLIALIIGLSSRLKKVSEDRDVQKQNVTTLFNSVGNYKVQDSLQAATIGNLQLTLDQFKQYRAEDAKLINDLRVDNNRLKGIVTTNSESYYQHTTILRDSITSLIAKGPDSVKIMVPVVVKTTNFSDSWHTLNIIITGDSLSYKLRTRESLLITNHIVPKRFLFFKWGCKEVRTDVVSKNPYVDKLSVESITIR